MKVRLEALTLEMYRNGILFSEAVREFKKRFILNVLRENQGNQCKAARQLGMHRNTLSRDIADLHIGREAENLRSSKRREYEARRAVRVPVLSIEREQPQAG